MEMQSLENTNRINNMYIKLPHFKAIKQEIIDILKHKNSLV